MAGLRGGENREKEEGEGQRALGEREGKRRSRLEGMREGLGCNETAK